MTPALTLTLALALVLYLAWWFAPDEHVPSAPYDGSLVCTSMTDPDRFDDWDCVSLDEFHARYARVNRRTAYDAAWFSTCSVNGSAVPLHGEWRGPLGTHLPLFNATPGK